MKGIHKITFLLLVVGGLNWLLFGWFNWELGANLLGGQDSVVAKAVYAAVGLSAVYEVVGHRNRCKECGTK